MRVLGGRRDPRQKVRTIAELEREAILNAVKFCGAKRLAAELLGISPNKLYRKLKEYEEAT